MTDNVELIRFLTIVFTSLLGFYIGWKLREATTASPPDDSPDFWDTDTVTGNSGNDDAEDTRAAFRAACEAEGFPSMRPTAGDCRHGYVGGLWCPECGHFPKKNHAR